MKKEKKISKRKLRIQTRHGFEMLVDSRDKLIAKQLKMLGTWQRDLIYLIGKLIKPGNTIINLGSHFGF